MARRYEYLFEIMDMIETGTQRIWTGNGMLSLLSHMWSPTDIVESVTIAGGTLSDTETRVTIVLFATTDAIRLAFLEDPGPSRIILRQVVSLDDGVTWTLIPRAFAGRITAAELRGDRYQVDLVDRRGDPLRPVIRYWSDEDQQRRHPGDKGLQYMKAIESGVTVRWP